MKFQSNCPGCKVSGFEHIQTTERESIVIVNCDSCGHMYGVFPNIRLLVQVSSSMKDEKK